jgi:predicted translin family RNA/ssDNA-binding protein
MKKEIERLKEDAKKNPRLGFEGTFKVAIQEYVEALGLLKFVETGKIMPYSEEFVDPENYLMGVCDLCGELVRKAINSSIKENYRVAVAVRSALEEIYTELSKFDFRNGELRRKYDGIKYELKKLDDVVFELKMKGKI